MTKYGLIASFCFFLASGCALFDGSEMTSEQQSAEAPVAENETVVTVVEAATTKAPVAPPRSLTRDDIRLMQLRLRDVGLDPGPVDGVAGRKPKRHFHDFKPDAPRSKR